MAERPPLPVRALRVAFEGELQNAHWANVMHFHCQGSGTISFDSLHGLVNDLAFLFASRVMPRLSSDSSLLQAHGVLTGDDGERIEAVVPHIAPGTRSAPSLPANCALAVTWRIQQHYRGGHPRTYLCGIPQDDLASMTAVTSAYAQDTAAQLEQFHTIAEGITASGVTALVHGTYSYVKDGSYRPVPLFYRFTNASVSTRLDSQRRRLGRESLT